MLYAQKKFIANGRHFKPGDPFEPQKMSVSKRRVTQMLEARMISEKPVVTKREPAAPAPEPAVIPDDLEMIDDMKELRAIADEIGAPYKVSKADQRKAIREKRAE